MCGEDEKRGTNEEVGKRNNIIYIHGVSEEHIYDVLYIYIEREGEAIVSRLQVNLTTQNL